MAKSHLDPGQFRPVLHKCDHILFRAPCSCGAFRITFPFMNRLRVIIAALLLMWSPLSGAIAQSLGTTLAHHHCNDVWHDHAGTNGVVVKGDDCGSKAIDLDASSCDDCQFVLAALPLSQITLEHNDLPQFHAMPVVVAQNTVVFAFFRPPKA